MKLRTNTLTIGTAINRIISDILPIFPIVAEKGADYPFAIYRRSGFKAKNSKDVYNFEEMMNIEIVIAGKTYTQSIELAQAVKDRLERYRGTVNGITINDITMTSANEDWLNDAFVQRLYFDISIDNNKR